MIGTCSSCRSVAAGMGRAETARTGVAKQVGRLQCFCEKTNAEKPTPYSMSRCGDQGKHSKMRRRVTGHFLLILEGEIMGFRQVPATTRCFARQRGVRNINLLLFCSAHTCVATLALALREFSVVQLSRKLRSMRLPISRPAEVVELSTHDSGRCRLGRGQAVDS